MDVTIAAMSTDEEPWAALASSLVDGTNLLPTSYVSPDDNDEDDGDDDEHFGCYANSQACVREIADGMVGAGLAAVPAPLLHP